MLTWCEGDQKKLEAVGRRLGREGKGRGGGPKPAGEEVCFDMVMVIKKKIVTTFSSGHRRHDDDDIFGSTHSLPACGYPHNLFWCPLCLSTLREMKGGVKRWVSGEGGSLFFFSNCTAGSGTHASLRATTSRFIFAI